MKVAFACFDSILFAIITKDILGKKGKLEVFQFIDWVWYLRQATVMMIMLI